MIHRILSLDHPALAPFARLTEAQLRNDLNPRKGLMVVESPKVILTALEAGYEPVSLLCEERHLAGDAAPVLEKCPGLDVYTGERGLLASLTGYTLTRGVLCAMRRGRPRTFVEVAAGARRLVVLHEVVDSTNVGVIFRTAAALGADGVVVSGGTCDPFNRRVVRVSMGSVFLVPWVKMEGDILAELKNAGFTTVATALRGNSVDIDDPGLAASPRLAVIMGNEGVGLPADMIAGADCCVKIPMAHGVDSLNVGAAAAIAIWELVRSRRGQG